MEKADIVRIVNQINAVWPLESSTSLKDVYAVWWNVLSDLDLRAVEAAVSDVVGSPVPWRPKPGEIRRRVVDGRSAWPSPEAAWNLVESRRFAADMGVDIPAVQGPPGLPETLTAAMRSAYGQGRHGFMAAWTQLTEDRYARAPRDTDIDGVQLDAKD